MDMEEIQYLLGSAIFARAKKYVKCIESYECKTEENGVRHLSAEVKGSGDDLYETEAWLRQNGSFVSASCTCPYNDNGNGLFCKHIGALLLYDQKETAQTQKSCPSKIGALLRTYREGELSEVEDNILPQRTGFVELEPELTVLQGGTPWLRLRISDGGRSYVVKSLEELLSHIENNQVVSYGKSLAFQHRWDAFTPEARQLLNLLRREIINRQQLETRGYTTSRYAETGPAGGITLTGETFDALVNLYADRHELGGYALKESIPSLTIQVERRRGGVQINVRPSLGSIKGLDFDYLYSEDTIWRLDRAATARMLPAFRGLSGRNLFFTSGDATAFCSYVLPELGRYVTIEDPERLLLNQIPLAPVTQFYLDAPQMGTVSAHLEFLYGEDRVTPFAPPPQGLLRDARTEDRAARLLGRYLQPGAGPMQYSASEEEAVYRFLDEGVPVLMNEGEVYLTDAFRNLQAPPPKISVGVSVHGSVLDLEVDTGAFPVGELKALLKSLHQKKRYHRLRDGRLLKLDEEFEGLDELNETLELSGVKLSKNCLFTGHRVWTGRCRGRAGSTSTATTPSGGSAAASMR